MAGNVYPKAPLHPDSWQCGAHTVEDPYLYLTNGKDPEVLDWVAQENQYTDQWFENTPIQERIRFLKEKKAAPNYSGFSPMGSKIYAGCTNADGKHSAVVLNEDFSHCETLLDSAAMEERMQVFGVVPCPADEQVAAFEIGRASCRERV